MVFCSLHSSSAAIRGNLAENSVRFHWSICKTISPPVAMLEALLAADLRIKISSLILEIEKSVLGRYEEHMTAVYAEVTVY